MKRAGLDLDRKQHEIYVFFSVSLSVNAFSLPDSLEHAVRVLNIKSPRWGPMRSFMHNFKVWVILLPTVHGARSRAHVLVLKVGEGRRGSLFARLLTWCHWSRRKGANYFPVRLKAYVWSRLHLVSPASLCTQVWKSWWRLSARAFSRDTLWRPRDCDSSGKWRQNHVWTFFLTCQVFGTYWWNFRYV